MAEENGVTRREFSRLEVRVDALEERERGRLVRDALLTAVSSAIGAFLAFMAFMQGFQVKP